jgi:hypothetical protein
LLTASNFYKIVTKQKSSNCANLIKSLLYTIQSKSDNRNLDTDARSYGKHYESVARKFFEQKYGVQVIETGIFIDKPNGYLGASPDGLLGEEGLLEIKCPFAARDYSDIQKAVLDGCIKYLDISDGQTHLIRNNMYYFQVIGQLAITGRKYCDFFVYLPNGEDGKNCFCERIHTDLPLWQILKPELERFYATVLLPELVDSRYEREMPFRDTSFGVSKELAIYRKGLGKTCAQNGLIKSKRTSVPNKRINASNQTPKRKVKRARLNSLVCKTLFASSPPLDDT